MQNYFNQIQSGKENIYDLFGKFDFKAGPEDSQEFEKFPRHSGRKKLPPPVRYHFLRSSGYQSDEEEEEGWSGERV